MKTNTIIFWLIVLLISAIIIAVRSIIKGREMRENFFWTKQQLDLLKAITDNAPTQLKDMLLIIYVTPKSLVDSSSGFPRRIEKFFRRQIIEDGSPLSAIGSTKREIDHYSLFYQGVYSKKTLGEIRDYLSNLLEEAVLGIKEEGLAQIIVVGVMAKCMLAPDLEKVDLENYQNGMNIAMLALSEYGVHGQETLENNFQSLSQAAKDKVEAEKEFIFKKYYPPQ